MKRGGDITELCLDVLQRRGGFHHKRVHEVRILRRIRAPIACPDLLSDAGLVDWEGGRRYTRVLEYLQEDHASKRRSRPIIYAHRELEAETREGEEPLAERSYLLHRLPWSVRYILIWHIVLLDHIIDEVGIFGGYFWQWLESS